MFLSLKKTPYIYPINQLYKLISLYNPDIKNVIPRQIEYLLIVDYNITFIDEYK